MRFDNKVGCAVDAVPFYDVLIADDHHIRDYPVIFSKVNVCPVCILKFFTETY